MTGFDPGRPRLRGLLSAVNRARLGNTGQRVADRLLRLLDAKARGEIPETDFVGLRRSTCMFCASPT